MAAALVPCGFCRATNLDHYAPFNCRGCESKVNVPACQASIHIHATDGQRSFVLWRCPTCGEQQWPLQPATHKALVDIYGVRAFVIPPEVDSRPRGRAVSQDDVWDFVIDMALWDGSLSELARG